MNILQTARFCTFPLKEEITILTLSKYTDGIFILRKRVTVTNLLVDVYFTF